MTDVQKKTNIDFFYTNILNC